MTDSIEPKKIQTYYGPLDATIAAVLRQSVQIIAESTLRDLEDTYHLLDEIVATPGSFEEKHTSAFYPLLRWDLLMYEIFGSTQNSLLVRILPPYPFVFDKSKRCGAAETQTIRHIIAAVNMQLVAEGHYLDDRIGSMEISQADLMKGVLFSLVHRVRRSVDRWTWPSIPYNAERVHRSHPVVVRADEVRVGDRIDATDWLEAFGSEDSKAYAKSYVSWPTVVAVEQTSVAIDIELAWPLEDDEYHVIRWLPKIAFDWHFNAIRKEVIWAIELPPTWAT